MQNTKEKCRKFLANLLELSSREPKPVAQNVCTLIQELIDASVEPDEFCDRLERLLNASPQPCLIGFLKVRQYLYLHTMDVPSNRYKCLFIFSTNRKVYHYSGNRYLQKN